MMSKLNKSLPAYIRKLRVIRDHCWQHFEVLYV
jgi:hypothetical protein